jgi:predicted aldo/keto reductase-like oxidoreductase
MLKSDRRDFIKRMSSLAASTVMFPWAIESCGQVSIPRRVLGRTGEQVSLLGMGGFHVGDPSVPDEVAIEIIRTSIDRGVNFMDNAWSYKEGRAETIMGRALKDGYREKVFLMTKLTATSVEEAKLQMEESLRRFDLDRIDLMQFHAIGRRDGIVDEIYQNGLIEWAEEQRRQGIFRYIGFTGHCDPKAHRDMIQRGYPWDTVQMPLNPGDHHRNVSFQKHVLPLALEKNIGVIGMKSNGMGNLGNSGIATPAEGLRFAMSLPVSTVVSGMDSLEILEENLEVFHNFTPMTVEEQEELLARSEGKSDQIEHYRRKFYDADGNERAD